MYRNLLPDPERVGKRFRKKTLIFAVQMDRPFKVDTLEGVMEGKTGDWLAKGVKGEYYPIAKDIFEQSYEEVV